MNCDRHKKMTDGLDEENIGGYISETEREEQKYC